MLLSEPLKTLSLALQCPLYLKIINYLLFSTYEAADAEGDLKPLWSVNWAQSVPKYALILPTLYMICYALEIYKAFNIVISCSSLG